MSKVFRFIHDKDTPRVIEFDSKKLFSEGRAENRLAQKELSRVEIASNEAQQILHEAQHEADRLLAKAMQEKDQVLNDARKEAESIKGKAYQDGFSEGKQQGKIEADSLIQQAEEIKLAAVGERDEFLRQAKDKILDLSITIAEKIINDVVSQNEDVVLGLLEQALAQVIDAQRVVVKVAPEDYGVVVQHQQDLAAALVGSAEVVVLASNKLSAGDCLIQTDSGEIDGKIGTGLQQVRKALQELKL